MSKRILLALFCAAAVALVLLLQRDDPALRASLAPSTTAGRRASEAAAASLPIVAAPADAAAETDRLTLPRAGQGLRGRVVDEAGIPIAGAAIFVIARANTDPFALQAMRNRGQQHESLGRAASESDGAFAVELPDDCGNARVEAHVRASAFAPSHVACTTAITEWTNVGDLVLGRGRTLRGTVRDALTQTPIADAEVTIHLPSARMLDVPLLSARTDGEGAYSIDNAPVGICNIAAVAAGHARHELPQQHIQRDESNVLDFVLQPGRALAGFVIDREGRACEGAFVRATPAIARETGVVGGHAQQDGSFRIEGIALGEVELTASAPGFGTTRAVVAADSTRPTTMQLSRLSRLRVLARDADGKAVAGLVALARGAFREPSQRMRRVGPRVATNAALGDATLELEGLEPGEWMVEAAAPGFAPTTSASFAVDVDEVREVTLVLTKGNRVLGRVVDQHGRPVGGALVRCLPDGALDGELGIALRSARASVAAQPFAHSKVDGTFAVERAPDGAHQLSVTRSGFAPRILRGVHANGGIDRSVGEIPLLPDAKIHGRALANNAVDRKIVVQLTPVEAPDVASDFVAECRVDASGAFRFAGLPRGRYALLAGRRDADDPFLENADQTRSRVEVEIDGELDRAIELEVSPR